MTRIARLGAVVLVSVAAGCGQGTSGEVAANSPLPHLPVESAKAAPPAPPPAAENHVVGDTVRLGSGSVAVEAVEANVQAGRLFSPPRGREYYAVQVRGCAGPREEGLEFRPEYFSLQLADHTVYEAGPGMKKLELTGGTVPAGGCVWGWVTFLIPEDGQPIAVVYEGSQPLRWAVPPPKAKPAH